jgi:hypothetical protein
MDRYSIALGKESPYVKVKVIVYKEPEITPSEKGVLADYLKDSENRYRFAELMAGPLRARRDYTSLARQAFSVSPIPPGALSHGSV